jgi:hypothetical protein
MSSHLGFAALVRVQRGYCSRHLGAIIVMVRNPPNGGRIKWSSFARRCKPFSIDVGDTQWHVRDAPWAGFVDLLNRQILGEFVTLRAFATRHPDHVCFFRHRVLLNPRREDQDDEVVTG